MGKLEGGSLFAFDDFRPYVREWVKSKGRGEFRRIAHELKMHTTLISQVFSGRKTLTEEQAASLCHYMGLNALETDYLLKLVQLDRAGTEILKRAYQRHLKVLRQQANEAKSRVSEAKELNERDRALFYSSWHYSMIRLLTSIEQYRTPSAIAEFLDLPIVRAREALDFLVSRGLCVEGPGGTFLRTERDTFIEASSPLAIRHHQNWRTKSLQLQEKMDLDDLAFTAPVALAREDVVKVREILLETISRIAKLVERSPSEQVAYLGIDWIRM